MVRWNEQAQGWHTVGLLCTLIFVLWSQVGAGGSLDGIERSVSTPGNSTVGAWPLPRGASDACT